jgi:hypothetical protein
VVPVPAEFGQSTAPGIAAIQELLPDRDHPGHLPSCASSASSPTGRQVLPRRSGPATGMLAITADAAFAEVVPASTVAVTPCSSRHRRAGPPAAVERRPLPADPLVRRRLNQFGCHPGNIGRTGDVAPGPRPGPLPGSGLIHVPEGRGLVCVPPAAA